MRQDSGRSILRLITAAATLAILVGCGHCTRGGGAGDALYFASPEAAVPAIDGFLRKEDWKTLARYYDLEGAKVKRADLDSGKFFLRTERPADAHPGVPWKFRHPFPPGYRYQSTAPTAVLGVVEVTVIIEIDEGGGPFQRGLATFLMRKGAAGYRVLPDGG